MRKLLGTSLLILLSQYVAAASWMAIGVSDKAAFFYDKATLKNVGKTKIVWIATVVTDSEAIAHGGMKQLKEKVAYHCESRTSQNLHTSGYDINENLLATQAKVQAPVEIVPGSNGEMLFETFCKNKPPMKPFSVDTPMNAAKLYFDWKERQSHKVD